MVHVTVQVGLGFHLVLKFWEATIAEESELGVAGRRMTLGGTELEVFGKGVLSAQG